MSGDLARWWPSAPERAHGRELEALDRRTQLAEEQVVGIARVEGAAVRAQLQVGLLAQEAMRLDPAGAEHYQLLRAAGTYGMANVIQRYSRGR